MCAAEFLARLGDPRLQRRAVHDVDRGAGRLDALVLERRDGFAHLIGVARAQADIGAFGRQRVGDGAPDAARAAQNDGVLAFKM